MRRVFQTLLILSALSLTACSYGMDFVVVNDSASPVEVSYRLKMMRAEIPFSMAGEPVKLDIPHLGDRNRQWRALSEDGYRLNYESRSVVVRLMPGEALRVAEVVDYGTRSDEMETKFFPIEEITVVGARGEIHLAGVQVHKTFSEESDSLYTLTYR